MKPTFPGFSPAALAFFKDLESHNNREWFQPRKEIFERVAKVPMLELIEAVNAGIQSSLPDHVTDPKKALFRIYRDTRFSSDKTPYKTRMAAVFSRRGTADMGAGGLYFSINHKSIEVAGGVYEPRPEALLAIRTHLAATHAEFRKIVSARKLNQLMGKLGGEELSRAPKGFPPNHPALDLLKKKRWIFSIELDPALALTSALLPELLSRFRALKSVLDHLEAPLLAAKRRPPSAFL